MSDHQTIKLAATVEAEPSRRQPEQIGLEVESARSRDWDSTALFLGPVEPAPKKSAKQRRLEAANLKLF